MFHINRVGKCYRYRNYCVPAISDLHFFNIPKMRLPRFSQSPAGLDAGRYAAFEAFLVKAGLVQGTRTVADLAVDLGAQ